MAVIPGLIADTCYALNAHHIYSYSRRLIPWGSVYEDIIGFTFLTSAGMLLVGSLLCLRNLSEGQSRLGILIAIVCGAIHAATVYYARHILLSFG